MTKKKTNMEKSEQSSIVENLKQKISDLEDRVKKSRWIWTCECCDKSYKQFRDLLRCEMSHGLPPSKPELSMVSPDLATICDECETPKGSDYCHKCLVKPSLFRAKGTPLQPEDE